MKLRLEVGKTTIRLNKDEFQQLTNGHRLSQDSIFPDGNKFSFYLELSEEKKITFEESKLKIQLPSQPVREHKPDKIGLSFDFKENNDKHHRILFEVDIKKQPLGSRKSKRIS